MTSPLNSFVHYAESQRLAAAHEAKSSKGHGWLYAIAKTLGEACDALGKEITDRASALDDAIRAGKKDLTEQNAELQALTQQMNMMMQATSTIIKTLGEGNATLARKQ